MEVRTLPPRFSTVDSIIVFHSSPSLILQLWTCSWVAWLSVWRADISVTVCCEFLMAAKFEAAHGCSPLRRRYWRNVVSEKILFGESSGEKITVDAEAGRLPAVVFSSQPMKNWLWIRCGQADALQQNTYPTDIQDEV